MWFWEEVSAALLTLPSWFLHLPFSFYPIFYLGFRPFALNVIINYLKAQELCSLSPSGNKDGSGYGCFSSLLNQSLDLGLACHLSSQLQNQGPGCGAGGTQVCSCGVLA